MRTIQKVNEDLTALELAGQQCYEALRKRRYRALNWRSLYTFTANDPTRFEGFAFLVGAYDAERYMWEKNFAMTPESMLAIEQEFLFEVGVVESLKIRPVKLSYLDGVRAALGDAVVFEPADEIELC